MDAIWCGIDWAERHYDVALIDDGGKVLAKERISDDAAGFTRLVELVCQYCPGGLEGLPIAIETSQGLLVAALRGANARLYPINPLAVARYRDRYSPSRAKSDTGDSIVLAIILRTDLSNHRPLAADSEIAQAIKVLARAHQDAVWDRQQVVSKTRSLLRQYFPAFLSTFEDLTTMGARVVLAMAPTPAAAAKLRPASVSAGLRRGGRRRGVPEEAARIVAGLRAPELRQLDTVETAIGRQALGYARSLTAVAENVAALEADLTTVFQTHPDAVIIKSFPGLGSVLGARLVGEMGDDRKRFTSARGLKAYAGTAPVTRASGTKTSIRMRVVRNKRPNNAAYLWALPLILHSTHARAHYDRRRDHGDGHTAASRNLVNRHMGMLHHCLATRQLYNAEKGYAHVRPSDEIALAS